MIKDNVWYIRIDYQDYYPMILIKKTSFYNTIHIHLDNDKRISIKFETRKKLLPIKFHKAKKDDFRFIIKYLFEFRYHKD